MLFVFFKEGLVAANKLNKQSRIADEGWSSSWGLGEVLTTPPCKTLMFRNTHVRDDSSGDKILVADGCECGNEPSGSVKCGEFLD